MRRRLFLGSVLPVVALCAVAGPLSSRLYAAAPSQPCCGPITPEGVKLGQFIDALHIEQLWQAHAHVNWETGEPDRPAAATGSENATHCSAFTAAAGKRLNIYLLRPPEHGQALLATAQGQWLRSPEGR